MGIGLSKITMENIIIQGKAFKPYLRKTEIEAVIKTLANKINADYRNEKLIFLSVLNGSFIFAADLVRELPPDANVEISFVKLSSYSGTESSGHVQELMGLDIDPEGKTVIVLEDIIETGVTLEYVLDLLSKMHPKEIKISALFYKPEKFVSHYKIDYVGFSIPNNFIIGYGLDYNGEGRNLKDVYQIIN